MEKHKHHVIPIAIILLFVSLYGMAKTVRILAQTETTISTQATCTGYNYTAWSSCNNGQQNRSVTSAMPAGCSGGATPMTTQSCTSTAPVCGFTYSSWGTCQPNGIQNRTVVSTSPSGCSGGTPALQQSCTYTATTSTPVPCTSYNYSAWGSCNNGQQSRAVSSAVPAGCSGGTTPITIQSCTSTTQTAPVCGFTYSAWNTCQPGGIQNRTVVSTFPSDCSGGTPALQQSCTYYATTTSTSIPCTGYNYSAWGSCNNGQQYRSVTSTIPASCYGGAEPIKVQSCTYSETTQNLPVCSFYYSAWNNCQTNGIQTRTITSTHPVDCSGGTPFLQQNCTYIPPTSTNGAINLNCTPSCSSWSSCGQDGYQIRTCTAPNGCPQTNWTEKNNCTNTTTATNTTSTATCAYQCASWSNCYSDGHQERTCQKPFDLSCIAQKESRACTYFDSTSTATTPTNCSIQCSVWSTCSPAGVKSQSCWPSPAGCSGETKTNTQTCAPTVCKFTYSDWGTCTDGMQFRTILTANPVSCVGGESILEQTCSEESTSEPTIPSESIAIIPAITDPEISINDDWKKEEFKTTNCSDQICGGNADPDNDGLSNNDEFRFGTNPKDRDTDHDGKTDGEEIAAGTDPQKSSAKGEEDQMIFENPKEVGTVKAKIYQVTNVEMVEGNGESPKQMKLTGKGPANSYVTVYVYSGQPVIITVKTDSNGDWTYTVDKDLENGDHEVYVAVTNNSGAIKAKSAPLPFVKTAEAITVTRAAENNVVQPTTKTGFSLKTLFLVLGFSFFGFMAALIIIGLIIKKVVKKATI